MAKKYKRNVSQSASRQVPTGDKADGKPSASVPTEKAGSSPYSRRSVAEFNPNYDYVIKDLKRIGTLAGSFFVILIILSFILNR